jgi:hypothetical protein
MEWWRDGGLEECDNSTINNGKLEKWMIQIKIADF